MFYCVGEAFQWGNYFADSMQVYRHMDIGTAKVTEEEKAGVPNI